MCGLSLCVALFSCSEKGTNPPPFPTLVVESVSLNRITACNTPIARSEIEVLSGGKDSMTFMATNSSTWLSLFNASGTTPGTFFVYFVIGGLSVGVYVDTIVITSEQASNSPLLVEVTLTIASDMEVSPRVLNFKALKLSKNPELQEITISDVCGANFSYALTESAPWLSLSPESGLASDTISVEIDITGLPTGIYTELITVDAPQTHNSPQGVICTLAVSTWEAQENVYQDDLRAVTFVDEDHGWAVGILVKDFNTNTGYIIATTDGGQNWINQTDLQGAQDSALADVVFIDAQTGWIVGGYGAILHTTNGGTNWVRQSSGVTLDFWGVAFVTVDSGWAVGRQGLVLHTTDGGDNWEPQFSNTNNHLSKVTFVDSRYGWVVGNAGTVIHSDNGGNTWVKQESGVDNNLQDVYFSDVATGWVVGYGGTILHTVDSGKTWTVQPTNSTEQLSSISFSSFGHGWAVGHDGTVLHTTDGHNWSIQVSATPRWLFGVYFFDNNIGWVVGEGGIILHTVSGGN